MDHGSDSARRSATRSTWLPPDFVHPLRVELVTGHHLRPISPDDTDLDLVAVRSSGTGSSPSTAGRGAGRRPT